jgi:hypothetical protein
VDSSGNRSCKRKAVSFSQTAKLRRVKVADDSKLHEAYSSWLTDEEVSSSKKRARNLSKVHYLKTRHDADARPNDRSGIVYNCHPAHYEIIGESLRGMEHITDASTSQKRIRLRSDTVSLIQKFQDTDEDDVETSRSKLANKYRESAKEALMDAKVAAEEDAKAAAQILAEDLKQESH